MSIYKPVDFASTTPPPRIMGTEMEYMPHMPTAALPIRFDYVSDVVRSARQSAGITSESQTFFYNGSRLYPDVHQVEYATPECLGARDTVCAEMAGQLVVADALDTKIGKKHPLYRRTGAVREDEKISVGYHQNFLTPPIFTNERRLRAARIMGAYLATRVIWAGSGMVDDGYVLSQKAHDISEDDYDIVQIGKIGNRTTTKKKPMLSWLTRSTGLELETHSKKWDRVEFRYADSVHSPYIRSLSLNTASLVLRLIEHPKQVPTDFWDNAELKKLPKVVKQTSSNLTLNTELTAVSGTQYSPIEYQQFLANAAIDLSKDVLLPEEELKAAYEWRDLCEDLRRIDFDKPETLLEVSDRVEWAARYLVIYQKLGSGNITKQNARAVELDVKWDQIYPHSVAEKYWRRKQPEFYALHDDDILRLKTQPPSDTRAHLRVQKMREHAGRIKFVDWMRVGVSHDKTFWMVDPFRSQ